MTDEGPKARPPRSEPEILPPGSYQDRGDHDFGRPDPRFIFIDPRSGRAIPLFRPSLLTILAIAGIVGLVVAVIVVLLLGAFLISLPVLGLLFVVLLVGGLLRNKRR